MGPKPPQAHKFEAGFSSHETLAISVKKGMADFIVFGRLLVVDDLIG